jgi:hypothetical protein
MKDFTSYSKKKYIISFVRVKKSHDASLVLVNILLAMVKTITNYHPLSQRDLVIFFSDDLKS